jgi:hypothetical protein
MASGPAILQDGKEFFVRDLRESLPHREDDIETRRLFPMPDIVGMGVGRQHHTGLRASLVGEGDDGAIISRPNRSHGGFTPT